MKPPRETCKLASINRSCACFFVFVANRWGLSSEGFEYVTYNDVDDLRRVVKRINRRGKIRSLFGRPRRAVAAIMMEALQVSSSALRGVSRYRACNGTQEMLSVEAVYIIEHDAREQKYLVLRKTSSTVVFRQRPTV